MYLLKFENILKEVLWGGEKITTYKGIPSQKNIGESWEISTVPDYVSIVSNGAWEGEPLTVLIERYKEKIVGKKVYRKYKNTLPLLFKLLNTKERCSLQVHPSDEIAKKRHNCNGKTEMWYIIEAEPDAEIVAGFSRDISVDEYRKRINENTLEETLMTHKVKAGDVFFIPSGLIHAVGKGLLLAEIQQSSDITYRVYDYGRRDANGFTRPLHIEEAIDALDFSKFSKTEQKITNKITPEITTLADCDFFHAALLTIKKQTTKDYSHLDSFVVYMCTQGACEIAVPNLEKTCLKQGESVLIPASIHSFEIAPVPEVTLIECYI